MRAKIDDLCRERDVLWNSTAVLATREVEMAQANAPDGDRVDLVPSGMSALRRCYGCEARTPRHSGLCFIVGYNDCDQGAGSGERLRRLLWKERRQRGSTADHRPRRQTEAGADYRLGCFAGTARAIRPLADGRIVQKIGVAVRARRSSGSLRRHRLTQRSWLAPGRKASYLKSSNSAHASLVSPVAPAQVHREELRAQAIPAPGGEPPPASSSAFPSGSRRLAGVRPERHASPRSRPSAARRTSGQKCTGEATECLSPNAAVMRAEALSRKPGECRRHRIQPQRRSGDRRVRRR